MANRQHGLTLGRLLAWLLGVGVVVAVAHYGYVKLQELEFFRTEAWNALEAYLNNLQQAGTLEE